MSGALSAVDSWEAWVNAIWVLTLWLAIPLVMTRLLFRLQAFRFERRLIRLGLATSPLLLVLGFLAVEPDRALIDLPRETRVYEIRSNQPEPTSGSELASQLHGWERRDPVDRFEPESGSETPVPTRLAESTPLDDEALGLVSESNDIRDLVPESLSATLRESESRASIARVETRLASEAAEPARPPESRLSAVPASPAAKVLRVSHSESNDSLRRAILGMVALWLLGVFFGISRCLRSLRRLRELKSHLLPVTPEFEYRVHEVAHELKFRRPIGLFAHPDIATPFAMGILRSVVVVPATWEREIEFHEVRPLIIHELAHLKSRDPGWRTLLSFVSAFFWPHPLVRSLTRREAALSEIVADRAVVESGIRPTRYARILGQIALNPRLPVWVSAGHGPGFKLERRIRMILDSQAPRRRARFFRPVTIGLYLGLAAFCLFFFRHPLVGATSASRDVDCAIEIVTQNGWWTATGKDPKSGTVFWMVRLAPTEEGSQVVLKRSLEGARIEIGKSVWTLDSVTGQMRETERELRRSGGSGVARTEAEIMGLREQVAALEAQLARMKVERRAIEAKPRSSYGGIRSNPTGPGYDPNNKRKMKRRKRPALEVQREAAAADAARVAEDARSDALRADRGSREHPEFARLQRASQSFRLEAEDLTVWLKALEESLPRSVGSGGVAAFQQSAALFEEARARGELLAEFALEEAELWYQELEETLEFQYEQAEQESERHIERLEHEQERVDAELELGLERFEERLEDLQARRDAAEAEDSGELRDLEESIRKLEAERRDHEARLRERIRKFEYEQHETRFAFQRRELDLRREHQQKLRRARHIIQSMKQLQARLEYQVERTERIVSELGQRLERRQEQGRTRRSGAGSTSESPPHPREALPSPSTQPSGGGSGRLGESPWDRQNALAVEPMALADSDVAELINGMIGELSAKDRQALVEELRESQAWGSRYPEPLSQLGLKQDLPSLPKRIETQKELKVDGVTGSTGRTVWGFGVVTNSSATSQPASRPNPRDKNTLQQIREELPLLRELVRSIKSEVRALVPEKSEAAR